jgi:hypothetical protein
MPPARSIAELAPAKYWIAALALTATLCLSASGAHAWDDAKYPNFGGQWKRPPGVGNQFDQTKRPGRAQQAPLTPDYQALFDANLKDQAEGGQGTDPTYQCIPDGMPRAMNVIFPMEIIVTPKTTYMLIEYLTMQRRVFTDGRDFPEEFPPSWMGYSIGKWIDEDLDGKYDVLEVETRYLKHPRSLDASGAPLHRDAKTIVKERIYLEKGNDNVLHDEITVLDHALTRPLTVDKRYARELRPIVWVEAICPEGNPYVQVQGEIYMRGADGKLLPAKKGQKPPDLQHFDQGAKAASAAGAASGEDKGSALIRSFLAPSDSEQDGQ